MESSDEDFVTSTESIRDRDKRVNRRNVSSNSQVPSGSKEGSSRSRSSQYRDRLSEDKKAERREKNRLRNLARRSNRSASEVAAERAKDRERKATDEVRAKDRERKARAASQRTASEAEAVRARDRERKSSAASKRTQSEAYATRAKDRARKADERANRTADEEAEHREEDRVRKAINRKVQKSSVTVKDGLRNHEILQGTFNVKKLEDTTDAIGRMNFSCPHCGAMKFKGESKGSCCSDGKVILTPFPRPPEELVKLWTGSDSHSKLLRKHSREINNAVCLSSIQVKEKKFNGFHPSIIIQGKVVHRAGALLPADGEAPKFAQVYVHDPALESTHRFANLHIPNSISSVQKLQLKEILNTIQEIMHQHNPFIADFKQILEFDEETLAGGKIVITAKKPSNEHARRYNLQTNLQEVSILTNEEPFDLVLQKRGGGLQTVSDLNPKGMALHFSLLFPFGTYGWDPSTKHADGIRRVTTREFFAYHIQVRNTDNENYLHMACRLFQEWICMGYISVENQRLNYQRQNQKALRADTYKNVRQAVEERIREAGARADGMYADDHQQPSTGRKILASSYTGSPRWYNKHFQDGMAIVREFRKPDFFITMTTNPNWSEIEAELLPGQTPQDRPELVARVFKLKCDQLMNDLVHGQVLGKVVAHMEVIEFQKRGLPHCHILLILADHDRLVTKDFVDSVITAELPPSPHEVDDPDQKAARQRLQDIVVKSMLHGPCGPSNPNSPCMENGKCTKNFPKEFLKETLVDRENSYATYRRRKPEDGGQTVKHPSSGLQIDNRWIVPYNAYLSMRYNCHINVECCASPKVML